MLYTAITRGIETVVLVGDIDSQRDYRGCSGKPGTSHGTPIRRELAEVAMPRCRPSARREDTDHVWTSSTIRSLRMMAQSMSSAIDGPRALPIAVNAYSTFGGTWG